MSDEDKFAGLVYTPGRFILNDAILHVDRPEVKIWEVDCRSKYPYLPFRIANRIAVYPRGDSLHLDESTDGTTFLDVPGRWDEIMFDGSKYTIRIAAYKWVEHNWGEG